MAIIVSDTSPIRALHHLNKVSWLDILFGEVFVPPAVVDELEHPAARFAPIDIRLYPFLVVRAPPNSPRLFELRRKLDEGEAEALALAEEMNAGVLIDEKDGRRVAEQMGLTVVGTVGILIEAKSEFLCTSITPLLDSLVEGLGFYVSARLRAQALRMAGE
ncbi:MAG: DUF3368 domain-containing protein [Pirellulaceae bacterium]|nr:DUF3368 domain-containing protein [Pirellulaceae bacterium]